jgi:2-keto-4-pentenoate hydratase/2-oxohepta-3-ene-1,7-dioic acid hydratase in catechol pathway
MKLCRFGEGRLGIVEESDVKDVTAALEALPACRYPLPSYDLLIANLPSVLSRARALLPAAPSIPLSGLRLLSPVANPGKIVAAPVNYQKHLDEVRGDRTLHQGDPTRTNTIHTAGLFLKATSSLAGPGEGVAIARLDRRTDHEVELTVVIGREARRVPRAEALAYVAGYSVGLDVTIRGPEERSFRKSPDGYSVVGPWLVTADEISDPGSLDLRLTVNGELRQQSNTRFMILGVAELIELASSFYTLYPGDIVFTGTPEGVSPIAPGDRIVATVDRVGTLEVDVRGEVQRDGSLSSMSEQGLRSPMPAAGS